MHSRSIHRLSSVLLLLLLASAPAARAQVASCVADIAVFDDGNYVDTSGGSGAESDTLQATLGTTLGHNVSTFNGITSGSWSAALVGQDILVIPEQEDRALGPDLSGAAIGVIQGFVNGGGGLIVMGSTGERAADFLNTVLGFALTESFASSNSKSLTANAAGTSFAGGPSTLPDLSLTWRLDEVSLPSGFSNIIYEDPAGGGVVVRLPSGSGLAVYLGWDWFEAEPLGSEDGGWVEALDRAVDEVGCPKAADLALVKSDSNDPVIAGNSLTYTLEVTNNGPAEATNVVLTDTLPPGVVFSSASSGCSESGGVVTCTVGTLANSATEIRSITVAVPPGATGTLDNNADATADQDDPTSNADSETTTVIQQATLQVMKTGDTTATAGQAIAYTIDVQSFGPSNVTGVLISDGFPAELESVTWTCSTTGGATCSAGSGTLSDTVSMPTGSSIQYMVSATVRSDTPAGTITNMVDVSNPAGPNVSDDHATTIDRQATLSATKTGPATAAPGQMISYTITVGNSGPSDASGVTVSDTFPVELTGITWTCTPSGGASCSTPGSGSLSETVAIPVGGQVVYNVDATVDPGATASSITNTASVTNPIGADASDGHTTALAADATLSLTKTGDATAVAGETLGYTITVSNAGPSDVSGATVEDTFPAELSGISWSCVPSGGASCAAASGAGNLAETVSIPNGGQLVYTVSATISPSATTTITNTATVVNPIGANASDSHPTTIMRQADLSITKSGPASAQVGGAISYTLTVANAGPSDASGAMVVDNFPTELTAVSWTCSATGSASCPASGSNDIGATVSIPAGDSVSFSISATVDPTAAAGTLTNMASVTPPAGVTDPISGNDNSSASTTLVREADLSVSKTGSTTAPSGGMLSYTVTISNAGPASVVGATVTDTFPAELSNIQWTCSASGGSCPAASGSGSLSTTVDLGVGGSATFSITADVSAAANGTLTNNVSVGVPSGTGDPTGSNNSDSHATTIQQQAELAMVKDGDASAVAGGMVSFTLAVSNAGPGDVSGARVVDNFPASLSNITWTCVATGGACPSSGSGNIDHFVDLPVGGSLSYAIMATIDPGATGTISNSATVSVPAGVSDPVSGNNTDGHNIPLTRQADLAIVKSGPASAVAGGPIAYTLSVTNGGPSNVTGATVADTFAAALEGVSWTCSATAGSCPASGTGNIDHSVSLDNGGELSYSITATLAADATGTLTNFATVAPPAGTTDPGPTANSSTVNTTLGTEADLSVTKTGSASATAGGTLSYQIVVGNAGPSNITGATITDTFPATLSNVTWTCAATQGSCTSSGTGNISDNVALDAGGSLTYSVSADIAPDATGSITNNASVASAADPNGGNNSDGHLTSIGAQADLSLSKTGDATATAGGTIAYTLTVSNAGPSAVTNATVSDTFPAALSNISWTCSASSGSCPGSGSGNLAASVSLDPGGSATFSITADVAATASGSITNTASVAPPVGTSDPVSGNNSNSHSTTLAAEAELTLTVTDTPDPVVAGAQLAYQLTVSNAGPSAAANTTATLVLPGSASLAAAGAGCAEGPPGTITCSLGTVAVGGNVSRTVTVDIAPSAPATLSAQADASSTADDPTANNQTVTTAVVRQADLAITKTDGRSSAVPGTALTYTLTVSNAGPSNVTGATVNDSFPPELTVSGWSCTPSAGAVCTLAGSGDLGDTVTIPAGGSLVYTVNATIVPTATGLLSNTATVTPPAGTTDPAPGNDSATDTTNLSGEADLSISKTDGQSSAVPGTMLTYTVVATNAGPSTVSTTVDDTFPTTFTGITWTCVGSGGGSCPASGSGDLAAAVTLPAGGSATFTITGTIDPAATGTLVNTATITVPAGITDPAPGNESATDSDILLPAADLSITKTDGMTSVVPGDTVTYTLTVSNAGPSNVVGATVDDTFPAALEGVTWSCAPSAGAVCGAGSGNLLDTVNIPAGGSLVYTASGTLAVDASGTLSNTANVTAPAGVDDPNAANDTANDTDTITPEADLSITKTDGVAEATPGGAVTYVISVSNAGPAAVMSAQVDDPFPAVLTCQWTCAGTGGGTCSAGPVNGAIDDSVDLPVGASITYTAACAIGASATGGLSNTAVVSAPAGVVDPVPANNTATDVDALGARADLAITKTDGLTEATPGGQLTYTLVATNAGPSNAPGSRVDDAFPAGLSCVWTCASTGGANCTPGQVAGDIADTFDLPVGASATYTALCDIPADATGTLANTATITAGGTVTDTDPNDNTASDLDTLLVPRFDLALVKTASVSEAVPGEPISYTLTVSHAGPSDAIGATVSDPLPTTLENVSWSCVATAGSTCTGSGTGSIADLVTVRVGGQLVYTIDATIAGDAAGTLTNTATVTPPAGAVDTRPSNDGDTVNVVLEPTVDLSITKTDGLETAVPGESTSYTVTVSNAGPSDAAGALVSDTLPDTLDSVSWTCAADVGSSCPASGSGDLSTLVSVAAGESVVFTIDAEIVPSAMGTLTNTATVSASAGTVDGDLSNNVASDSTMLEPRADLAITKDDGLTSAIPGESLTYTVMVSNAGPSSVADAAVEDLVPAALDCQWTCTASGGGACDPGPIAGDLTDGIDLPPLADVTYTGVCSIAADATGSLENVATVSVPEGVEDPDPADNSAEDTTALTPTADLVVSKDDGQNSAVPGDSLTYLITVSNAAGPSDLRGVVVDDAFPASLDCAWTCSALGGGTCNPGQVTGDLQDIVDLPVGALLTYTAVCTIDGSATGSVVNAAILTLPAGASDPNASNNSDTDTTMLRQEADLAITKTDGVTQATPGGSITYTMVVEHLGGSDLVGAVVTDDFPAVLDCSWTCAAENGGSCNPGQVLGDLEDTVTLPAGARLTYTAVCAIDPSATGVLQNTATVTVPAGVTDSNPGNNSASDLDTALAPRADLSILKTDGVLSATPGESVTYTITVRNLAGPSDVVGATVEDLFPTALDCQWSCAIGGAASCTSGPVSGDLVDTVDLPVGSSLTYTAVCAIDPLASGTLVNMASIAVPAGTTDPVPGNNEATDDDTVLDDRLDLSVTVDDGATIATPGGTTTYTIVVAHDEPATFGEIPRSLLYEGLTAVLSALDRSVLGQPVLGQPVLGQPALGQPVLGQLSDRRLDPLETVAFELATSGDVLRALERLAAPPWRPATDPAKDAEGDWATKATVGGLLVRDLFPAGLDCSWTCVADPGATCTAGPVNGDINDSVTLPEGTQAVYSAICAIAPDARGTLANSASLVIPAGVLDIDPANNVDTDIDTLEPAADLAITKTDGTTMAIPGGQLTYTLAVSNPAGPSDVFGAQLVDTFAPALDCLWSCVTTGGATCSPGQTAGDLQDLVDLPVGGSATYTATCTIDPAAGGMLANTAHLLVPADTQELDPADNTASDLDTQLVPTADLAITKTDGVAEATPGESLVYTLVVSNVAGPSDLLDATVGDVFPGGLDCLWSCTGSNGAICNPGQVAGDLLDSADLPVGAVATYTATCAIDPAATGMLVNTATVTVPVGSADPVTANDSASDDDTLLVPRADLVITKDDGVLEAVPGGSVTYTITVSNPTGPSAAIGATVEDLFPAILDCTWTCSATGSASCTPGPVSGDLVDLVDLPPGESLSYQAVCAVDPQAEGQLINSTTVAMAAPGLDPDLASNSASDIDALVPHVDLAITKTDHQAEVVPGESLVYELSVSNAGPSPAMGALVSDTPPAGLTCTWSCVAGSGATCPASTPGNVLAALVDLQPGAGATLIGECAVDPGLTGTLVNTATVSAPAGATELDAANNMATDTDLLTPRADLSITKTDGRETVLPGGQMTYTLVVSNAGPSDAVGATVSDPFPTALACEWTCTPDAGSSCTAGPMSGDLVDTVTMAAGEELTYSAVCTVDAGASGELVNTATVTAPAGVDPEPANNTADDSTLVSDAADLGITVIDDPDPVAPGGELVWLVTVSNQGPATDSAVVVTALLPAQVVLLDAFVGDPPPIGLLFRDGFESGDTTAWGATSSFGGGNQGEGGSPCSQNGATLVCTLGPLAADESIDLVLLAEVLDGASGTLINTLSVAGAGTDPDSDNDSAVALTTVAVNLAWLDLAAQCSTTSIVWGCWEEDHHLISRP